MIKKSIPHIITSLNLFCGFAAIVYSFEENKLSALLFIIAAMILDSMDGRAARMLGVEGDFGKELDSLADVVTFGVAPALLLYHGVLQHWGTIGLIVAAIFPVCGALRLARFNTKTHKVAKSFVGLPITAAGAILALFAVNIHFIGEAFTITLFFGLSYLMVSNIKFPNFKHVRFPKHTFIVVPMMVIVIYLATKLLPEEFPISLFMPVPLFFLLVLSMIKRVKQKKKTKDTDDAEDTEEPIEHRN